MMNFQKIGLLLIVFFIIESLSAQIAPGYLGKTLIVSYEGGISPTPFHPNKNGEEGFTSFTYKHKVAIDYVRTRKTSIGVAYEMYSTGLDNEFSINALNPEASFFSSRTLNFRDANFGTLNVKGISFYRLKYKKGIAPLGKYNTLGVKLLIASTDLSTSNFINSNNSELITLDVSEGEGTYYKLGFLFGSGVSRVIKDKVVLSFGVNVTILPFDIINSFQSISLSDVSNDTSLPTSQKDIEEIFKKQAVKRLFGSEILTFKIGIGFLAH